MKFVKRKKTLLVLAAAFSFGMWIIPAGAQAQSGADAVCYDCHADYDKGLELSSHSAANKLVQVGCTSCHIDYQKHVDNPSVDNITRPAKLTAIETLNICSKCHFGKSENDFAHAGEHFKASVNCLGCHKIHEAKTHFNAALAKGSINETCMSCHSKEKHQFTLFSQHPVLSGAMNCTDCHDYFKSLSADLTSKLNNQTCYKCHGEMDGPFMHEHEATRDFGVENGGCINCHSPHGSPFANLLKEPTPQLCQQCHAIPHPDSPHGNEYANINCMDCHTDIHGSDDNKSLIESGQYSNLITNCRECHHRP